MSQQDLEKTALAVIKLLKQVPKYSNLRVAVIGGLAGAHHGARRVTKDIDFFVDVPGMGVAKELKKIIKELQPDDFEQQADVFVRKFTTSTGAVAHHQVDLVGRDLLPYVPSAAIPVQDIAEGEIPYISLEDLVILKVHVCGLRKETKGKTDATDAEQLLAKRGAPLTLTQQQKAVLGQGIDAVLQCSKKPPSWWLEQLGLLGEEQGAPFYTSCFCLSVFGLFLLDTVKRVMADMLQ